MPYNLNNLDLSFHTKKLCSRLSSSEVRFFMEISRFTFLNPLWGLRKTYDVHLGLTGKRVVNFLLALIELYSLVVMAEPLRVKRDKNRRFRSNTVSLIQNFR